jgi:hypothetical protein
MARMMLGFGAGALFLCSAALPLAAAPAAQEAAVESSRPQVTIHPRRIEPGPNAKRYCESWLATEYRVSGTVIVPKMRCWWQ